MNPSTRLLGGRYEVGELLGRGGMADVHLGRDARLGRTVAIKMLRSDLARDPSFQARFRREAQSAAGLNHPAVVAVYDSGEDIDPQSGVIAPYIVMEYVEGRTLRELLTEGQRLPWAEALRLTSGVLAALGYSHTAGIVHRDIKPANVMLTPSGDVKVMDFGIARALADSSATMTQTQAVIGTAQYLSPEQARGETVDARSDLYSTGCLLFELITGRPPFIADSPVAVAYQHVGETPSPPSSLVPDVPSAVDSIVLHALVKDREERYQTAEEFRKDVDSAVAGRSISSAASMNSLRGSGAATVALSAITGLGDPVASTSLLSLPGNVGEEEPGPRRRQERPAPPNHTGLWIFLGVLAAAILAAGGLILSTYINGNKSADKPTVVSVPDLSGFTIPEAKAKLAELKISLGKETRQGSDKYAKGQIVTTEPVSGTDVSEESAIDYVVSTGPNSISLPDLVGKSETEAKEALKKLGLKAGSVERVEDSSAQKDEVVETSPTAGTQVDLGEEITLKVASGKVIVPNVVNLPLTDAIAQLTRLGLKVDVSKYEPAPQGIDGGVVLEQTKRGESVDQATKINLTVSETAQTPTGTPTPSYDPSVGASPSVTPPGNGGNGNGNGNNGPGGIQP